MVRVQFLPWAAVELIANGERIERHRLSIFSENFSQQFLSRIRKISCLQSREHVANEARAARQRPLL
jgi:hypothetical protein